MAVYVFFQLRRPLLYTSCLHKTSLAPSPPIQAVSLELQMTRAREN